MAATRTAYSSTTTLSTAPGRDWRAPATRREREGDRHRGGRTTTLDFLIAHPDKSSCRVRWSFTPAAGKTYLVAGALTAEGCNARLLDATHPDHMKAETSAQRRDVGGSACSALVARPAATAAAGGEQNGEAVLRPGATADDLQGPIAQ